MRDLATLTVDDFRELQGSSFRATAEGVEADLVLEEVLGLTRRSGTAEREAFSLLFRSGEGTVLPQQLYRLSNETFGDVEGVLLVPVFDASGRVGSEAIFT